VVSLRNIFLADIFFPTDTFLFSPGKKKFVMSTATAAVQSKSNSHANVYYQPVEFTSCVRCFVFEEVEVLPWGHHLGLQLPQ
jgi:hypothetical protein